MLRILQYAIKALAHHSISLRCQSRRCISDRHRDAPRAHFPSDHSGGGEGSGATVTKAGRRRWSERMQDDSWMNASRKRMSWTNSGELDEWLFLHKETSPEKAGQLGMNSMRGAPDRSTDETYTKTLGDWMNEVQERLSSQRSSVGGNFFVELNWCTMDGWARRTDGCKVDFHPSLSREEFVAPLIEQGWNYLGWREI